MSTEFDPMRKRINDLMSQDITKVNNTNPATATDPADISKKGAPVNKDLFAVKGESPSKKYGPEALKNRAAHALWQKKTGIGLDPEVKEALKGPMKLAAIKLFVNKPHLARTEEGAKLLLQLMSNVEDFEKLA